MADANTSIVNNDNLLLSYFNSRAIKVLHEKVTFYQIAQQSGQVYQIPEGSGTQVTWNGFRPIAAASSTLAEASGNAATSLSSRKINVSVTSRGRVVKLTDLLQYTSVLDVNEGALRELEQSAALTIDNELQRAIFKTDITQCGQLTNAKTQLLSVFMSSPASAFCANTGTMNASNRQFGLPAVFGTSCTRLSAVSKTAPSISAILGPIAIRRTVARLKRLNVDPMADGTYVGVAHPNAIATMLGNPDWKQWHLNYSGQGGPSDTMYKHEVAVVHQVRLLDSTNAPRYAVAAHSVTPVAIFGMGCLAAAELDGSVKYLISRPGEQSTNDPFRLNSLVAFKVRMAGAILNPSAGAILFVHEKV